MKKCRINNKWDLILTEKLLDYQHEVHLYYEKADFGTIEEVALK